MKIIRNRIRCKHCNEIIESKSRHDFVSCKCDTVSVDGGLSYMRRAFKDTQEDYEELSEWELDCDDCVHSEYKKVNPNKLKLELYCELKKEKCPEKLDRECFIER